MDWISVKDKFPHIGEQVLSFSDDTIVHCTFDQVPHRENEKKSMILEISMKLMK